MPIDIETLRPLRKFLANFAVNGFRLLRQPVISHYSALNLLW